jgi:hypothetical protein
MAMPKVELEERLNDEPLQPFQRRTDSLAAPTPERPVSRPGV